MTDQSEWQQSEERWSEWLVQAQGGDQTAYASLLGELDDAIRGYLISRFGHSELLDDCVQDCLIAVHEARHTYDPKRRVRPWLFAIVRHRMIDLLRKRKPQEEVSPALDAHAPSYDREHDGERLLSHLSGTLREPILLTKFVGLSTRECATRLGVSESVVKVRVFRGLRKLRAMWESETT